MTNNRAELGDEAFVRSKWKEVSANSYSVHIVFGPHWDIWFTGSKDSWLKAADYTESREQQIKWKEEEIDIARGIIAVSDEVMRRKQRILATLTEQLAELKKGWRG